MAEVKVLYLEQGFVIQKEIHGYDMDNVRV